MSTNYEEVKKFADQTLGEMPQVIDLLFGIDENSAMEQFLQNKNLYLGRTNLELKTRVLIAISVALANGPKESALIHFKLAKKFGIDPLEVLDAIRATKMVLMSSTLDSAEVLLNSFGEISKNTGENAEAVSIIERLQEEGDVPERIKTTSKLSVEFMKEHLREKSEMLKPIKLQRKYVFLIAFAVSASLRDRECQRVYLEKFVKNGGAREEAIDALATVRFLSGNRAFVNGLEILRNLVDQNNAKE